MQLNGSVFNLLIVSIGIFFFSSMVMAQSINTLSDSSSINIEKARTIIESRDKQFSKYFLDGDSLALVNMYTKDTQLGSSKGAEIPSVLGNWIRNSIKNDSRNVIFTTTSLSSDAEFLIEIGIAETRDS